MSVSIGFIAPPLLDRHRDGLRILPAVERPDGRAHLQMRDRLRVHEDRGVGLPRRRPIRRHQDTQCEFGLPFTTAPRRSHLEHGCGHLRAACTRTHLRRIDQPSLDPPLQHRVAHGRVAEIRELDIVLVGQAVAHRYRKPDLKRGEVGCVHQHPKLRDELLRGARRHADEQVVLRNVVDGQSGARDLDDRADTDLRLTAHGLAAPETGQHPAEGQQQTPGDPDHDRSAESVLTGEGEYRLSLVDAEQALADPDDEPGGEQQPDDEEHDAEHALRVSSRRFLPNTDSAPGPTSFETRSSTLGSTMPTRDGVPPDSRTTMPTPLIEREITAHVSLTTSDGTLNRDALGWSRTPVHDTSGIPGRGHWGRNKRWEYWNVMTPSHIIALTISNVDYMALHEVWVLDRATGVDIGSTVIG